VRAEDLLDLADGLWHAGERISATGHDGEPTMTGAEVCQRTAEASLGRQSPAETVVRRYRLVL